MYNTWSIVPSLIKQDVKSFSQTLSLENFLYVLSLRGRSGTLKDIKIRDCGKYEGMEVKQQQQQTESVSLSPAQTLTSHCHRWHCFFLYEWQDLGCLCFKAGFCVEWKPLVLILLCLLHWWCTNGNIRPHLVPVIWIQGRVRPSRYIWLVPLIDLCCLVMT